MPYIETLEDVLNQYADWMGVYGACKCETETEGNPCTHESNPHCCRGGFMIEQKERILKALENESRFDSLIN